MTPELERFERIVKEMCKEWDCPPEQIVKTDENGWTWVMVGRNASHDFHLGHNHNGTEFAIKSFGESWEDPGRQPSWETDIYRRSPTIIETLAGAYIGHF